MADIRSTIVVGQHRSARPAEDSPDDATNDQDPAGGALMKWRNRFVIAVTVLLAGCDSIVSEQSNSHPWTGYAWQKEKRKLQWVLASFESRRDCMESMKHRVNNPDNEYNESYSEPFGCGYHGNSYWRVWLMMTLYGGDFACMWRSTEGIRVNAGYGPLLKGYPHGLDSNGLLRIVAR
jgi:hypothetical protein